MNELRAHGLSPWVTSGSAAKTSPSFPEPSTTLRSARKVRRTPSSSRHNISPRPVSGPRDVEPSVVPRDQSGQRTKGGTADSTVAGGLLTLLRGIVTVVEPTAARLPRG